MKSMTLSVRTTKEILRDPINLAFGFAFPVLLLLLLTAIQANVPVPLFELDSLTPAIAVFGFSFFSLFTAVLVARDRETAFLERLYTAPLKAVDFIIGYALPVLPLALAQSVVCYLFAFCLGLTPTLGMLYALLLSIPVALFFIALGLLCGSVCKVKSASGLCGALLTNLTAWLSGGWFDLSLVGGVFEGVANLLPFVHGVELGRLLVAGSWEGTLPHLLWVVGYALAATVGAVVLFLRQMKKR